jgi:hypothetical protein
MRAVRFRARLVVEVRVSKGVPQRPAPRCMGWCTRMQRFATWRRWNRYTKKAGRKRADVSDPVIVRRGAGRV